MIEQKHCGATLGGKCETDATLETSQIPKVCYFQIAEPRGEGRGGGLIITSLLAS
jgi:hypothetical protein